ncbi:N-acetyltransferase [Umezawaea sp. NPDC059074]|uniref:N-acetyltransferase n=1 Tax=Umezawaea sp. NPDC059074 TaxID=3346716 RepID=UPI0036AECDCE
MAWLPADFVHPTAVPVTEDRHLRPIRATDVDLDYPLVMGARERLWATYGEAWGWPPATMTHEQDRVDLARHEREADEHKSFNYALFNADETVLYGCVYVDPPRKAGADAELSWWTVDDTDLDAFVPAWIAAAWPFTAPRHVGRDLTWAEWIALPDA